MNKYFISVIIPVFNSSSTIEKSLSSVIRELKSNQLEWEIIVIDDGSIDDPNVLIRKVLKEENCEKNIKYIKQENRGVADARNVGLKLAKGDLIAFNDSDDEWLEGKLKAQLEILESDKNIDMVGVKHGNPVSYTNEHEIEYISFNKMLIKARFPTPGVLFYRTLLQKVGYFPANRRNAEDLVFFYKMTFYGKCVLMKEIYTRNIFGKHDIGISGLSGDVYKQSIGQFKNLYILYNEGLLTLPKYIVVWIYNFLLMIRRIVKTYIKRL
jgi:glycosyltransferase involved in cell wall biosynthesis